MADEQEFKFKGAASQQAEAKAKISEEVKTTDVEDKTTSEDAVDTTTEKAISEDDRVKQDDVTATEEPEESHEDLLRRYRWCKCLCDPAQFEGRHYYFLELDTQESRWEEPSEPYWLWDTDKGAIDAVGLQQSLTASLPHGADGPDPNYYGYNPKIHGSYDPTAPYALYHERKRQDEALAEQMAAGQGPSTDAAYVATGTFNRFTGGFQSADKSADRHNDYNKSGRQMDAFFNVDAAANSHEGKSLIAERRNEKLSKEQIRELNAKRKAKKLKKRMDFYKS